MTLVVSANRILIDDAGHTVLDTSERLFTVTNGPLTGTVIKSGQSCSVPSYTTNTVNGYVNRDDNTVVASINGSADTVRGAFKINFAPGSPFTSVSPGVLGLGWFNASGTYIHWLSANWDPSRSSTANYTLDTIMAFTFIASGGQLIFNERTRLVYPSNLSGASFIQTPNYNIDYHLFCGAFV
jgi:hypothetical protein